jgi:hypothetical protein
MDKAEKERIEKANAYSQDMLDKGLILDDEAASQIRRMIYYNQERIKNEYKEEQQ